MDRSFEAVRRQIDAMGGTSFEIGLFKPHANDQTHTMFLRTYEVKGIFRSIPQFKFENCRGANIFIRPAGEHHLSMVDDLNADSILRMKNSSFSPALVVETSPGNFQAWLMHPRALRKELSTAVARSLAKKFGGDTGAADWRHFGRLAGFTNRKSRHQGRDGLFPYVKVCEASGAAYNAADEFISQVESQLNQEKQRRAQMRRNVNSERAPRLVKSIEKFRANPVYAGDATRIDLAYAVYALSQGASAEQVEDTIRTRDLSHKGGDKRQADYVARTIKKAISLVDRS